jgi:hypothetical protein
MRGSNHRFQKTRMRRRSRWEHDLPELFLALQPPVRGANLLRRLHRVYHGRQLFEEREGQHLVQLAHRPHERAGQAPRQYESQAGVPKHWTTRQDLYSPRPFRAGFRVSGKSSGMPERENDFPTHRTDCDPDDFRRSDLPNQHGHESLVSLTDAIRSNAEAVTYFEVYTGAN